MKLKLLDLFSGIGGFSLGLESTGYFETIAFVEKDKFCQQVLKKNFKNIPNQIIYLPSNYIHYFQKSLYQKLELYFLSCQL